MVPFIAPTEKLYNILLSQVHGCYRFLDAKVVRSGTGGRGGEEGEGVVQAE